MARARNIKPAFFSNEDLAELEPITRLLFIGLWTLADREGRIENRPKRIKAQLFAYDDCNINEMLGSLEDFNFIKSYESSGTKVIQVINWNKHQNPHHKEVESVLPADIGDSNSVCDGYMPLSNTIRKRIYDRDGRVCACCESEDNLEIDHIVPVKLGGNSVDENLQVLCKRCNVKKFDKIMDFKVLRKNNPSLIQAWANNEVKLSQEQVNEIASCTSDSLNLIPLTLNPIKEVVESKASTPAIDKQAVQEGFDHFWKTWLDCKKLMGVKNISPKGETFEKKWKPMFNESFWRKHGHDGFDEEVNAICEHAKYIHDPSDEFCPARNLMTGKFFSRKGWKDE